VTTFTVTALPPLLAKATALVDASWLRWCTVLAIFGAIIYRQRSAVRWSRMALEVAIAVTAYFAYFLVRGATEGSRDEALANARDIIALERNIGFYWEPRIQDLIIDHHALVTVANWVYIWGHWPVIIAVGVWLYLHDTPRYIVFRNAFLISGAIGLLIFMTYPVAPPRLADADVIDTVTEYSYSYRALQPRALVNQYAAVPSLHFGWNLLLGIALFRELRSAVSKTLAVLLPLVMLFAIVATANHFIFDAITGALVALTGLAAAYHITPRIAGTWAHRVPKPA
jgi:hypothetical protein